MASELTFRRATWAEIEAGAMPLFAAHWREVGHDFDYALDCETYRALDAAGELRCMIARNHGCGVSGYSVSLLRPWLHCTGKRLGYVDAYYLAPDARKGLAGVRFLRAIEADLRAAGADMMLIGTMAAVDRSTVLERLGFDRAEVIYRKDFT